MLRPTDRADKTMDIALTAGTARLIAGLLMVLSELPSTPRIVAEGAFLHMATLERKLPSPHHPQPWDQQRSPTATITVDADTATAIAELLELFDEISSTPPAVAADARHQAALLRGSLERAEREHAGGSADEVD